MEHRQSSNPRIERLLSRVAALGADADSIGKRHPTVGTIAFDARDALAKVFELMSRTGDPVAGLAAATEWLARISGQTYRAADKAAGRARSDLTRLAANARLLGVSTLDG